MSAFHCETYTRHFVGKLKCTYCIWDSGYSMVLVNSRDEKLHTLPLKLQYLTLW